MDEFLEVLSEEQQTDVVGGFNWGCAGGAMLIGGGIATGQIEAIAWGVAWVAMTC